MGKTTPVILTAKQRRALEAVLGQPSARAGHARRIRVVLLSADGLPGTEVARRVGITPSQVSRIRVRFKSGGIQGLADQPKAGRKDHALSPEIIEQIEQLALSPPPAGRSRWTARLLARHVKISRTSVVRVLKSKGLKPHLVRTYKVSRDPEFAKKVKDVVGLYLNPPDNALVLSVDEKTGIQALERTQRPLPLRSGRAATHTHDYRRHGVVDLFAALNLANGQVVHECKDSHNGADFLAFMKRVAREYPRKELHVILDNSSTHGTPDVKKWLADNPRVHFHYTPTSASWLNQVEGFFGILGKQSLSMTDFPSKTALRSHIEKYMSDWNQHPSPFAWTKPAAAIIRSHKRMLARISGPVH